MTVGELVLKLAALPQDAVIVLESGADPAQDLGEVQLLAFPDADPDEAPAVALIGRA